MTKASAVHSSPHMPNQRYISIKMSVEFNSLFQFYDTPLPKRMKKKINTKTKMIKTVLGILIKYRPNRHMILIFLMQEDQ